MTDYRTQEQKLYDAIVQTPAAEVEAYNAGRAHALSDAAVADEQWYEDTNAVGDAFWRGVQDGTATVQRLVNALGEDDLPTTTDL